MKFGSNEGNVKREERAEILGRCGGMRRRKVAPSTGAEAGT